jgi:hypothetical protein
MPIDKVELSKQWKKGGNKMNNYFISGVQNGKYIAGILTAPNKGQLLADTSKNGIMINYVVEMTEVEKKDFEKQMNKQISKVKKGIITPFK